MKKIAFVSALVSACFQAGAAGFIDHVSGTPYTWALVPATNYKVDIDDPLGATTITNAQVKTIIQKAFQTWESTNPAMGIVSSSLSFVDGGATSENINLSNYENYFKLNLNGTFESQPPHDSGVYIILDSDGKILEDLLGSASSMVLGISSAGKFDSATKKITAGFAIINGAISGISETTLAYTMTHELGHLMNLSHTQLNQEEAFDNKLGINETFDPMHPNPSYANDVVVPLMFPYITSKAIITAGFLTDPTIFPGLMELDDQLAIGFLYPNQTAFDAKGIIKGKIRRRTGEYVRGANVICRNKADERESAVSWISDQTYENKGGYLCGNLSSADYTVYIEPVELAINTFDPDPPFVPKEYYSGTSESYKPSTDDATQSSAVTVTAGTPNENIDVILNESGRLMSGVSVSGTIKGAYPDYEYFISVPPNASSLKVELTTSSNVDLDLYGRCDSEFSLAADVTAPPFYDPNGGQQQAQHAAATSSGNETIIVNSGSKPSIKGCTYHILVNDFFKSSANNGASFELKATIYGVSPRLSLAKSSVSISTFSGFETKIATQTLTATGDTFNVTALKFQDVGTKKMKGVTAAKLYEDTDADGELTAADRLLGQAATLDTTNKLVIFSGIDEYVTAGTSKSFFITYDITAQASLSWWFSVMVVGMIVLAFAKRRKSLGYLLLFTLILSCSREYQASEYEPALLSNASVEAQGLAFGNDVTIDPDFNPDSVADFFN